MNHQPDHDLETLLSNTRYVPPQGYESRLQAKLDALVNQHGDSITARLSTHLTDSDRRAIVSKRRINVLAFAIVAAGLMIVGLILILPTLPVPQPAVQPHQTADLTPTTESPTPTTGFYIVPLASRVPLPMDLTPGALVQLPIELSAVTDIAFSPDGDLIAVATESDLIIWVLSTGHYADLTAIYGDQLPPPPYQIAYSSTGRLAIGGKSPTLMIIDPRTPFDDVWLRTTIAAESVLDLAFSGDGTRLIASYVPGKEPTAIEGNFVLGAALVVWDMVTADQTGEHTSKEEDYIAWWTPALGDLNPGATETFLLHLAANSDGTHYGVGTNNGMIYNFDAHGSEGIRSRFWTQDGISSIAFRYDREYGYLDVGTVSGGLWEMSLGDGTYDATGIMMDATRTDSPQIVILSSDSSIGASVLTRITAQVRKFTPPTTPITITIPASGDTYISAFAFSPDSTLLAIGLTDGTLWLWRWG